MSASKAENNNIKAVINSSYNRLYAEFTSPDLSEVGNYRILKPIGEGTFGKVYLAYHRLTHTKVVLKTSDKTDPNVVREAFYHRQFEYPYITKLYEIIITESKVWMAQEYCPGKELYDYLLSKGRLSLDESAKLFSEIVGAVYYAHSLHCIHRDLKLENILLAKDGTAKLTDFGFTRECSGNTQLETVCGTTVYMAPELIRREKYDGFKVDVWSLGVILYTLINGTMPFDEEDKSKTEWKIVNENPIYNEDIMSVEVKLLLERLLAKDPSMRPSTKEILKHPFLGSHGMDILEQSDKMLSKRKRGMYQFHNKTEKKLLRRLKQTGIDTQALKSSVQKKKCDSLSGLWLLLLEKEKHVQDKNCPTRSRSVLSMKKVFDNDNKDLPVVSRTASLKRYISVSGFSFPQEPAKTDDLKPVSSKGSPAIMVSSTPKKKNDLKDNLLTKFSNFFKNKKVTKEGNNLGSGASPSYSMTVSTRQASSFIQNKPRKSTQSATRQKRSVSRSPGSSEIKGKLLLSPTENFKEEMQSNSIKDVPLDIRPAIPTPTKPILKKMRSTTSSEFSGHISTGNYDSESISTHRHTPTGNARQVGSRRPRPTSSVSQYSQRSNDTFNSDYSTDGDQSVARTSDATRTNSFEATWGNIPERQSSTYKKKFIRRDMSIMSNTSSTSEMSSRTDSFYDLAAASAPVILDSRNTKRSSSLGSPLLARYDTKHLRAPGASRPRHNLRRRKQGRSFMKHDASKTQSIIQEESSSGDEIDKVQQVKNALKLSSPVGGGDDDDDDIVVQSEDGLFSDRLALDDEADSAVHVTSFKGVRSLSEGSTAEPKFDLDKIQSRSVHPDIKSKFANS